jgi:hypothetical protein
VALTIGKFTDTGCEVFARVENYFVGSGLTSESSLLVSGHSCQDAGSEPLGNLDEEQSNSSCAGMDED